MRYPRYALLFCLLCTSAQGQQAPPSTRPDANAGRSTMDIRLSDLYNPATGEYFQPQPVNDPGFSLEEITNVPPRVLRIAILDSGFLHAHPLLKRVNIVDKDFTGEGPEDQLGHGTFMILQFLVELPPNLKVDVLNVKVTDKTDASDPNNIRLGMEWAVGQGADILSLSVGAPKVLAPELCDYTEHLLEANPKLVITAAAGNDPKYPMCPAAAKGVITVGASEIKSPIVPMHTYSAKVVFVPVKPEQTGKGNANNLDVSASPLQKSYLQAYDSGDYVKTGAFVRESKEAARGLAEDLILQSETARQQVGCDASFRLAAAGYQMSLELGVDDELKAKARNQLAKGYRCKGAFPKAAIFFMSSAKLLDHLGDKLHEAMVLKNLGMMRADDEKLANAAIENFRKVIALVQDSHDQPVEIEALTEICSIDVGEGWFDDITSKDCQEALKQSEARPLDSMAGWNSLFVGEIHAAQFTKGLKKVQAACSKSDSQECAEEHARATQSQDWIHSIQARNYFKNARAVCSKNNVKECVDRANADMHKLLMSVGIDDSTMK